MSEDELAGHVGHLTTEQEEKLQLFWLAIAKVCGVAPLDADSQLAAYLKRTDTNTSTASDKKVSPKRRFSLNWGSGDTAETTKKEAQQQNDKYGQTKAYHQVLSSHSPEAIRETIWGMVQQDHPDALALRFLRARKWDVDKALVMLVSAVNWRTNEMKIASIMSEGEEGAVRDEKSGTLNEKKIAADFMTQQRMGKGFIHGVDKKGRPICVVRVKSHKIGAQSGESLERYIVHIIETARLTLQPPVETANIVFDMTGFTLANMDYHPVKFIIQCFEANYPECLGIILIHNAPWIFQGIWRIIRGWLDPVVAAKVQFTNYRAGLEEHIPVEHILKELDGDEDWEYRYIEPMVGENDRMKDTATRDKLLAARAQLYTEFENLTEMWIRNRDNQEGKAAKAQREEVATKLRVGYWELDPYIRARSLYDRTGEIVPGGGVNWYKNQTTENESSQDVEDNGLVAVEIVGSAEKAVILEESEPRVKQVEIA